MNEDEKLLTKNKKRFNRLRKKKYNRNENKQFYMMFIITYLISIVLSTAIMLNSLDDVFYNVVYSANIPNWNSLGFLERIQQLNGELQFYNCQNLSIQLFFGAKLLETLVPTTITFGGTILILQMITAKKNLVFDSLLFCLLVFLTTLGVAFTTVKTVEILILYLILIAFFLVLSLVFSKKIYTLQNAGQTNHKIENSDGKMIRS